MNNSFIKIPNSVIDFSSMFHESLVLALFTFLKKTEGRFGTAMVSIDSMKRYLFFDKRRVRTYRDDILRAIMLLSCELEISEGDNLAPLLDVKSEMGREIFETDYIQYNKIQSRYKPITRNYKSTDGWYSNLLVFTFLNGEDGGFTVFSKKEYDTMMRGIIRLNKKWEEPRNSSNEWRGDSSDLFVGYLSIKKIIQRNLLADKKHGWFNLKDKLPKSMISTCLSSYSTREISGILKTLVDINMLQEETINRNKFYSLNFKLEDVILQGGNKNADEEAEG